MRNSEIDDFRQFGAELAKIAIAVVSDNRVGIEVEIKADGTPLTPVDVAVEAALRNRIESAYPEHGIRGEELPPRKLQR